MKLLQESNSRTPLLAAPEEEVEVEEEMGEVKIDIPTQVKNSIALFYISLLSGLGNIYR